MILIERFTGSDTSHDYEHLDYEEVNLSDEEIQRPKPKVKND